MEKILLNEDTNGNVPLERWHLVVLVLKMISKLQFTCIYILLVPCTYLFLIIIIIVIVVVVVIVVIVPFNE